MKSVSIRPWQKFNPNHMPAGTPEGGQFAPADGGSGSSASSQGSKWLTEPGKVGRRIEDKDKDAAFAYWDKTLKAGVRFRHSNLLNSDPNSSDKYALCQVIKRDVDGGYYKEVIANKPSGKSEYIDLRSSIYYHNRLPSISEVYGK